MLRTFLAKFKLTYSFFQASFRVLSIRSNQEMKITLTMRNEIGRVKNLYPWRIFHGAIGSDREGVGCHRGEYEGWKQSSRWMALFAWHSRKRFVLLWILMLRARKNFNKKASSGSCDSGLLPLSARMEQTRWGLDTSRRNWTRSRWEMCNIVSSNMWTIKTNIIKIHHCFSIMEYIYIYIIFYRSKE